MNGLRQQKLSKIKLSKIKLRHSAPLRQHAARFVQAIQQRYANESYGPALELLFRQFARVAPPNHHYYGYHIQLTPRLTLNFHGAARATSLSPAPSLTVRVLQPPGRSITLEHRHVERVVQRLLAREVRVDSVAGANSAPAATALVPSVATVLKPTSIPLAPASARPIDRIMRRSAPKSMPSPQSASPPTQPSNHAETQIAQAWQAKAVPPMPSLSGAEVNRLADQVIQVIDRRVSAHRERLGRS